MMPEEESAAFREIMKFVQKDLEFHRKQIPDDWSESKYHTGAADALLLVLRLARTFGYVQ